MLNMKTSLHSCHIEVKQNHAHLVHCTLYSVQYTVHCTMKKEKLVARKNLFKNQCYVTMVLLSLKKKSLFF